MISLDSLKKHILILGSDSFEGRGTGMRGGQRAAEYITEQFARFHLLPVGDDSSYYQNIPMHGSVPLEDSRLRFVYKNGDIHDFELHRDYLLDKTGAQTFVPNPLPLVFVGYGINAPEFNYNDYQSMDVSGKIVVFLDGEPVSSDTAYFSGKSRTIYSLLESKQRMAIARGAAGSIMIPNLTLFPEKTWEDLNRDFSFEYLSLSYNVTGQLSIILNPAVASVLFQDSPYTLNEILQMAKNHELRSFPLNNSISFKGQFIQRDFTSPNVIALQKGNDTNFNESYVLVSAHYDHLGIGPAVANDSIYNGVIDNASGIAAFLEIARLFSKGFEQQKRSIIFIATTGEEKGLLGATYYVDHPVFPLHRTVANVNIDGLAFFDEFYDVIGIGAELSSIHEYLQASLDLMEVSLTTKPQYFEAKEFFYRSDQIAFAYGGIPSLLIMEGVNWKHYPLNKSLTMIAEWMNTIYHSPFDDLDQHFDFAAAQKHAQIIFQTIYHIVNSSEPPKWNKGVLYKNIRLQTIAEKR